MNIYLIGYRCTGKTSVGQALARKLNRRFLDADEELVREQGRSIAQIVEQGGWEEFRKLEKQVIQKLGELREHVIAPGGGAVLDPENTACMRKSGHIVWLRAAPETIEARMLQDAKTAQQRPSLTGKALTAEIEEVLAARNPIYAKAGAFSVDTDGLGIDAIRDFILERLGCQSVD